MNIENIFKEIFSKFPANKIDFNILNTIDADYISSHKTKDNEPLGISFQWLLIDKFEDKDIEGTLISIIDGFLKSNIKNIMKLINLLFILTRISCRGEEKIKNNVIEYLLLKIVNYHKFNELLEKVINLQNSLQWFSNSFIEFKNASYLNYSRLLRNFRFSFSYSNPISLLLYLTRFSNKNNLVSPWSIISKLEPMPKVSLIQECLFYLDEFGKITDNFLKSKINAGFVSTLIVNCFYIKTSFKWIDKDILNKLIAEYWPTEGSFLFVETQKHLNKGRDTLYAQKIAPIINSLMLKKVEIEKNINEIFNNILDIQSFNYIASFFLDNEIKTAKLVDIVSPILFKKASRWFNQFKKSIISSNYYLYSGDWASQECQKGFIFFSHTILSSNKKDWDNWVKVYRDSLYYLKQFFYSGVEDILMAESAANIHFSLVLVPGIQEPKYIKEVKGRIDILQELFSDIILANYWHRFVTHGSVWEPGYKLNYHIDDKKHYILWLLEQIFNNKNETYFENILDRMKKYSSIDIKKQLDI